MFDVCHTTIEQTIVANVTGQNVTYLLQITMSDAKPAERINFRNGLLFAKDENKIGSKTGKTRGNATQQNQDDPSFGCFFNGLDPVGVSMNSFFMSCVCCNIACFNDSWNVVVIPFCNPTKSDLNACCMSLMSF